MGFFGIGQRGIGSRHLHDDAVIDRTIENDAIGSQNLSVSAVAYETQIKGNILGFGRLTTGLQGSFSSGIIGTVPMNKLEELFEHGRVGSIEGYTAYDRVIGTTDVRSVGVCNAIEYLPDKYNLAIAKTIATGTHYLLEIGTESPLNIIGSIKFKQPYPWGMTLAKDKNRLWITGTPAATTYAYQYGTTTMNKIGSIKLASSNARGIAYADDSHNMWVCDATNGYIYEIGTRTGNVIGSFESADGNPQGLALSPVNNHLFCNDGSTFYIYEIGTNTGNIIGSFKTVNSGAVHQSLAFSTDKNNLWAFDRSVAIRELGTAFERAHSGTYIHFQTPFGVKPDIAITQIDDLGNKQVFIMEPALGSFWLKAGTYPAKAMWMAWGSR